MVVEGAFVHSLIYQCFSLPHNKCLKKEETQTQMSQSFLFHLTVNIKANSCSSETETSEQNTKVCGAGTSFVVTGMYILGGNLLSSCTLKIKPPKQNPV